MREAVRAAASALRLRAICDGRATCMMRVCGVPREARTHSHTPPAPPPSAASASRCLRPESARFKGRRRPKGLSSVKLLRAGSVRASILPPSHRSLLVPHTQASSGCTGRPRRARPPPRPPQRWRAGWASWLDDSGGEALTDDLAQPQGSRGAGCAGASRGGAGFWTGCMRKAACWVGGLVCIAALATEACEGVQGV